MGRLILGEGVRADFADRDLAHLHRTIITKLARGEGLHLSWKDDPSIGDGRTTVWVHPGALLVCKMNGPVGKLNPAWLAELEIQANTVEGLHLVPEPGVDAHVTASAG